MSRPEGVFRLHTKEFCTLDGCYLETQRSSPYCVRHHRQNHRTGTPRSDERYSDRVTAPAGAECGICGRSVYEHGVTEFCELVERIRVA